MSGARRALVLVALAAPIALATTRFLIVPTVDGHWHGLVDAPGVSEFALALAGAVLLAALMRRCSGERHALVLLLCLGPAIPAASGWLPALLVFQGPAVVILAALAAGALIADRLPIDAAWLARIAHPGILFAAGLTFFLIVGRFLPGPAGPQGDEPHYLTITQSLLSDGDLDLTDEFANREYASFFPGELGAHASPASPPVSLYSIHAPGLAWLLLPGYALLGYTGAKLTMSALAALAAAITFLTVRRVTGRVPLALGAWLALVVAPPLPFYAVALYPEVPAALATALFLWMAAGGAVSLLVVAPVAAALPWIHPKLLPLAAAGVLVAAVRSRGWGGRAAAVLPLLLSLLGLLLFYERTYGAASLTAAYGPGFGSDVSPSRAVWGAPALLFDRQFGLLAVSPVWLLAVPGALMLWRSSRSLLLVAVGLAGSTFLVGASFSMWWGGACPPARFVVPALPGLALCVAVVIGARRRLFGSLLGGSAAVLAIAAYAPRAIHNRPDGASGFLRFVSPALDLDAALPSFIVGDAWAVVLVLSLCAALALAWRFGVHGALAGGLAFLAVGNAGRDAPWVDPRGATLETLRLWDGGNLVGQPLELPTLRLPVDLREPEWPLSEGTIYTSRRLDLPPGAYRVKVTADVVDAVPTAHVARITPAAGGHVLGRYYIQEGAPPLSFALAAPVGLQRLSFAGSGVQGRARVEAIEIVPQALVPRSQRAGFAGPLRFSEATYRVEIEGVLVTVLGDAHPEGDGFRLEGEECRFVVEPGEVDPVLVRVETGEPSRGDFLAWGSRRERLEREGVVEIHASADEGTLPARWRAIPLNLRSSEAWVGFSSGSRSSHSGDLAHDLRP